MMDTTEKYVKMCKEAEVVQDGWNLEPGDCVAYPPDKQDSKWTNEWYGENDADAWETKELKFEWNVIWLPRQDQLQEMTKIEADYRFDSFPYACVYYLDKFLNSELPNVDSMEQLWLAFVMHEKYDKLWDDKNEKWINKPQQG